MCDIGMPAHPDSDHDSHQDARMMAKAEEIRSDKKRFKALQKHTRGLHQAVFGKGSEPEEPKKRSKRRKSRGRRR